MRLSGLTPEQIIALAEASGSPALKLLVTGHIQAGNAHLAEVCLSIPAYKLVILDLALPQALARAAEAGAVAAVAAHLDSEAKTRE